jgi:hypothetical protein
LDARPQRPHCHLTLSLSCTIRSPKGCVPTLRAYMACGCRLEPLLLQRGVVMTRVGDEPQAADTALMQDARRALLRGPGPASAAGRTQRLMVVVSDDADFQPLLRAADAAGWQTAAVCEQIYEYPGAGVTLDWGRIKEGA